MVFHSVKDNIQKFKILQGIKEKSPVTGPYSVHIDLTNHCNNDCIACWSFSPLVGFETMDRETRGKQLSYETAIRLIDDLSDMGAREIYFTGGGEPFMHPKAVEIMEHVKKKSMRCDMSTNFTLIDEKKAVRLINARIDHMNCSVWAGSPEIYEKTHPNKDKETFNRMEKMLRFMSAVKSRNKSKYPKITLYNVISRENYGDFENMVELAYKTGADAVNFTPADIVPGFTDQIMLTKEQSSRLSDATGRIWNKMAAWEKKYNHKIEFREYEQLLRRINSLHSDKGLYDREIIGKIPCYAGFTFLRILATGEVNSCLKSGRIPIGNIHKESIKQIWTNEKQEEFRKHTLDYKVDDPFFEKIGNTTQKGNGCLYCCDNIGWNIIFNEEMQNLGPVKRKILKLSKYLP